MSKTNTTQITDINTSAFVTYACKHYGFNEALANAALNQFGVEDFFKHTAYDVGHHGIDGGYGDWIAHSETVSFYEKNYKEVSGFGGWISYAKTVSFYEKNYKEIKAWLLKSHDEFNCQSSIIEHVASFELVQKQGFNLVEIERLLIANEKNHVSYQNFANAMSWQVATDLCKAYIRWSENNSKD